MDDNSGYEVISSDNGSNGKQKDQVGENLKVKGPGNGHNGKSAREAATGQKVGKHPKSSVSHTYQTLRAPKGSMTLYIAAGVSVVLVALLAIYVTVVTRTPWSPTPEAVGSLDLTPAVTPVRAPVERPKPIVVVVPPVQKPQPGITPNAVVDVPGVGLRNAPDITGKTAFNSLRLGERVEIVKRVSGSGPAWVKIKTKAGRTGWVFASVVRELKRR